MDAIPEKFIHKMRLGGNGRFQKFLSAYDLAKAPITTKYHTKAAEYYRKKLQSMAEGTEFNLIPPSYEEGRKTISISSEGIKERIAASQVDANAMAPKQQKKKGFFDSVINAAKDFGSKTKKAVSKAGAAIVSSSKKAGSFVAKKTKTAAKTVWEGGKKIKNNKKVKSIMTTTKKGFSKAGSAISGAFNSLFGRKVEEQKTPANPTGIEVNEENQEDLWIELWVFLLVYRIASHIELPSPPSSLRQIISLDDFHSVLLQIRLVGVLLYCLLALLALLALLTLLALLAHLTLLNLSLIHI
eukprot:TRINITY_DN13368_c0_g1_i3.p2 TRINITY_DN13368_c0_g1~~TRINITY_DN13368_c0_g1_i3.p2  ORF type:complete len:299 (+),score=67.84 TRINITY_DN13368_c0_g1_i3:1327-2223(+)